MFELEEEINREFLPFLPKSFLSNVDVRQQLLSKYPYCRLQANNGIRLLRLDADGRGKPLRGHLLHVSLDVVPCYEALSYCWGSPERTHKLLTKEGEIHITASLQAALTRLRLPDRPRLLWADAVCINQDDLEEKSEQVLLMPKIYSSASKTIVHLGQQSDRSYLAIYLLERIARTNFSGLSDGAFLNPSLAAFGLPPITNASWVALRKFWSRPWFRRVWIVQEFLLAKDVVVICGHWEKDWRFFLDICPKITVLALASRSPDQLFTVEGFYSQTGSTAMTMLCEWRSTSCKGQYSRHHVKNFLELDALYLEGSKRLKAPGLHALLSMLRQYPVLSKRVAELFAWDCDVLARTAPQRAPFSGFPLLTLIVNTEEAEATDTRDRLFALLGLANDLSEQDRQMLRPNYNEAVEQTICRYASVLIRKGHCLEILYRASLKENTPSLPSWVGSWTLSTSPIAPGLFRPVPLGGDSYDREHYRAGGTMTQEARIGHPKDVLILRGCVIDRIDRHVSLPLLPFGMGFAMYIGSDVALKEVDDIFSGLSTYSNGESIFEVKWRTLIANTTAPPKSKAPPYYGEQYKAWREHIKFGATLSKDRRAKTSSQSQYADALLLVSQYRVFRTRGGFVGLAPLSARVGDQVCVFLGGVVPFVIRPSEERVGMYRLIGGCYIHGLMDGEAFALPHWQESDLSLY